MILLLRLVVTKLLLCLQAETTEGTRDEENGEGADSNRYDSFLLSNFELM